MGVTDRDTDPETRNNYSPKVYLPFGTFTLRNETLSAVTLWPPLQIVNGFLDSSKEGVELFLSRSWLNLISSLLPYWS